MPPRDVRDKYMITDNLTDQDIENKFTSLSLAFKTDKLTLTNRLELQQRQRDNAEKNIEEEIRELKSAIGGLNRVCLDSETRDVLQRLSQQVDVLRQSAERVSSSAEVYGAVQQEARISRAIEIMLMHVDNLKRIYEREHSELEDAKKILADHNLSLEDGLNLHSFSRAPAGGASSAGAPASPGGADVSNPLASNGVKSSSSAASNRVRSISVISPSGAVLGSALGSGGGGRDDLGTDSPKSRRASLGTPPSSSNRSNHHIHFDKSALQPNRAYDFPARKSSLGARKVGGPSRKTSFSQSVDGSMSPIREHHSEIPNSPLSKLNNNNHSSEENNNLMFKSGDPAEDFSHVVRRTNRARSTSLIHESVKEEDEVFAELDDLAAKRDVSPAPGAAAAVVGPGSVGADRVVVAGGGRMSAAGFGGDDGSAAITVSAHIRNVLKHRGSVVRRVSEWYQELNWPYDWDETVLGMRYALTGLLLFGAFLSLVLTFFGSSNSEV